MAILIDKKAAQYNNLGFHIHTQNMSGKFTRQEFERILIARAWKDENYLKRLIADPKSVIEEEFGYQIPDNIAIKINVIQEADNERILVIPHKPAHLRVQNLEEVDLEDMLVSGFNTISPAPTVTSTAITSPCDCGAM